MRTITSFNFFDWFTIAAALWFIYHGAVGIRRRELAMFGHRGGRAFAGTARGRWAVLMGLLWIVVGAGVLYGISR